jgi:hypothetical protein
VELCNVSINRDTAPPADDGLVLSDTTPGEPRPVDASMHQSPRISGPLWSRNEAQIATSWLGSTPARKPSNALGLSTQPNLQKLFSPRKRKKCLCRRHQNFQQESN